MAASLLLVLYVAGLVWVILDSYVHEARTPATERVGAYLWGATIAPILAAVVLLWWLLKSVGSILVSIPFSRPGWAPTPADTDRVREWFVFPHEQAATGLTGRGQFRWTPT